MANSPDKAEGRSPVRFGSRLLILFLLAVLEIVAWLQVSAHATHERRLALELAADHVARRITRCVGDRLDLLQIARDQWLRDEQPDEAEFRRLSTTLQAHFEGFQAINWIDAEGVIRWVVPLEANRPAMGRSLRNHPAAPMLAAAETTGQLRVTPPIELLQGGHGFATYLAIDPKRPAAGVLNGVFRAEPLLDACLAGVNERLLHYEFRDGEALLTEISDAPPSAAIPPAVRPLPAGDRTWTLTVAPTAAFLDGDADWGAHALLLLGLLLILGLAYQTRQLAQRQQRLEESELVLADQNTELQALLFLAAHDLRTPLVTLAGHAGALVDDIEDAGSRPEMLGPELSMTANAIERAAQQMSRRLDGLEALGGAVRAPLNLGVVDVEALVAELVERSRASINAVGAVVDVGDLPRAYADAEGLRSVFGVLLDNALRFQDSGRRGRVKIRGEGRGDLVVYTMRDNGRGIDPQMLARIFEPFNRAEVSSGEGMGLAIARRVLRRMGGEIRVDSTLGQGTLFEVTLPKR